MKLHGATIEVVEEKTGKVVDRVDVAAEGLAMMTEAVEHAGGTMDNSHLRLVRSEED
jgi:hypothetical protein